MKITIMLVFGFMISITSVYSQSIENLTSDQKKEYNRRKLTVEQVSETSGGMGWYWGFFSKRVDTWRAFKGLANQIEPEEFFRITGYTEEATKVKKNLEDANGKIGLGWVLYFGGLIGSLIPKTETHVEEYTYIDDLVWEETTYPYLIPGTIAWAGGLWLVYDGMLKKLQPVAPYQTAADIAEEYNKGIIDEITK